jgi:hypothetical protein
VKAVCVCYTHYTPHSQQLTGPCPSHTRNHTTACCRCCTVLLLLETNEDRSLPMPPTVCEGGGRGDKTAKPHCSGTGRKTWACFPPLLLLKAIARTVTQPISVTSSQSVTSHFPRAEAKRTQPDVCCTAMHSHDCSRSQAQNAQAARNTEESTHTTENIQTDTHPRANSLQGGKHAQHSTACASHTVRHHRGVTSHCAVTHTGCGHTFSAGGHTNEGSHHSTALHWVKVGHGSDGQCNGAQHGSTCHQAVDEVPV